LSKAIEQFNEEDFKGEGAGITEGSTNYYQATDSTYLQDNKGPTKYHKPNIKNNIGIPARFSLSTYNFSLKDSGGIKDSTRQNSGASSGSISSETTAALAARVKLMEDANAKATLKGVNVAAKDAALRESLASGAFVSSLGSAGANALGQRGSSFGSMGGGNSSSNSDKNDESSKDGSNQNENQFGANGFGIPSGGGKSGFQGVVGGAGSGLGSSSSSSSSSSKDDPTGLSDEEKDVMSANYERNKKDYKTSEEDSLFQVLSKTYVRNLDKVLTRKKKLDDEAEAREVPKP
jgi:hypothetical protein